ncbi:hypothetical protein [Kribbella sp. NPDC050459]|uniref:hypothetical protein n=1 Tax=Kribbella sp. NPDC050459 TaxID=3155785 RepID=UPI0033FF2D1D
MPSTTSRSHLRSRASTSRKNCGSATCSIGKITIAGPPPRLVSRSTADRVPTMLFSMICMSPSPNGRVAQ